jgi:hypothetical protein
VLAVIAPVVLGRLLYQQVGIYRDAKERQQRGERIVAAQEGLTIWQGDDARFVPWSAIIGYEFPLNFWRSGNGKYAIRPRIRTASNAEYSFSTQIEDYPLLIMILRTFATDAVEYKRSQNEKEALGGVAALWSGGEEGKGDRVFHRRTRTVQLSSIFIGFLFAVAVLASIQLPRLSDVGIYGLFLSVPVALFLGFSFYLSIAEYLRERFQVGTTGITYINKHGKARQLGWDEIAQERIEGNAISLEGKNGEKIQLDTSRYAYGNELPTLLVERIGEHRRASER